MKASAALGPTAAALYLRVSTEEQAVHGVSLDAQRERAVAYCAMQGLRLAPEHIFVDDGISAGKPLRSRPAGGLLLDAIARNEVGHVITVKLDRLFRDAIDCLTVAREWERDGVAMHLIDLGGQTVNTRTAMGSFFLLIMAGCAEMERGLIRERTRTALQHKKSRGDRLGTTPLGFRTPAPGQPMEPDDDGIRAVWLVFKLRRQDHPATFRAIARTLEARGFATKRGGKWDPRTVKGIWDRRAKYSELARNWRISQESLGSSRQSRSNGP